MLIVSLSELIFRVDIKLAISMNRHFIANSVLFFLVIQAEKVPSGGASVKYILKTW